MFFVGLEITCREDKGNKMVKSHQKYFSIMSLVAGSPVLFLLFVLDLGIHIWLLISQSL